MWWNRYCRTCMTALETENAVTKKMLSLIVEPLWWVNHETRLLNRSSLSSWLGGIPEARFYFRNMSGNRWVLVADGPIIHTTAMCLRGWLLTSSRRAKKGLPASVNPTLPPKMGKLRPLICGGSWPSVTHSASPETCIQVVWPKSIITGAASLVLLDANSLKPERNFVP